MTIYDVECAWLDTIEIPSSLIFSNLLFIYINYKSGSLAGAAASKIVSGVYKGIFRRIKILTVERNSIRIFNCKTYKLNRNN
jgi:hypothetical protein